MAAHPAGVRGYGRFPTRAVTEIGPTDATEVTTPAPTPTTATPRGAVARLFVVTAILSLSAISGRDYLRDENLNFSWVFDNAHQPTIAGSVELSTASFCGGKGAQHG